MSTWTSWGYPRSTNGSNFYYSPPPRQPKLFEVTVTLPSGEKLTLPIDEDELEAMRLRHQQWPHYRAQYEQEQRRERERQSRNRPRFNERGWLDYNTARDRVRTLAGVDLDTAKNMTDKVLYRAAMRKCHPDMGGSHDLWLELDGLKKHLDLD